MCNAIVAESLIKQDPRVDMSIITRSLGAVVYSRNTRFVPPRQQFFVIVLISLTNSHFSGARGTLVAGVGAVKAGIHSCKSCGSRSCMRYCRGRRKKKKKDKKASEQHVSV